MYRKILVPLDGSELAECVLPHVNNIVKIGGVEEVICLRVVEPLMVGGKGYLLGQMEEEEWRKNQLDESERYLQRLLERLIYHDVTMTPKVIAGSAAEAVVDFSTKEAVDLIIMATHGRSGVARWLMGSVAERVLHWSCVPVLMIRPPQCVPKI